MILAKVLHRLRPNSLWKIHGDLTIEDIEWLDENQSQPSREEIEAEWAVVENEVEAKKVRKERDFLLTESDWVTIRALETGNPVPDEWKEYRQQLRNVPQQNGFPMEIIWPEKP